MQDILVAISHNGEVQLWNTKEKSIIYSTLVSGKVTSADISPDDKYLVIGTNSSCLRILDLKQLVTVKTFRLFKKNKSIDCIQFGPSEGEHKNRICVSSH